MAEIPIFSPLVTHVPEVGKTSKFFWYILRWTRHHKKKFKFLGQKGSEICKVKYRDFETFSYILHPIRALARAPKTIPVPKKIQAPSNTSPIKLIPT